MKKKETVAMQDEYIQKLTKNLSVLRASTEMTQAQLAEKVGVSRQTIVAIETQKRPMPWTLYLALICIFMQYKESQKLLESFKLFDENFAPSRINGLYLTLYIIKFLMKARPIT